MAAVLAFVRIWQSNRKGLHLGMQKYFLALAALFFVFVAMEEMNWGQTYFNFETPQILSKTNIQQEVSLHNLHLPIKRRWANDLLFWMAVSIFHFVCSVR